MGYSIYAISLSTLVLFALLPRVDAAYGISHGPITCLCVDSSFQTLDYNEIVAKDGCSLFDRCETCTTDVHQPCASCPPGRYGVRCQYECNCGIQPCDDGVNGDGECHCETDDYLAEGRCHEMEKMTTESPGQRMPSPNVFPDRGKITVTWIQMLSQYDPIVGYELDYKKTRGYTGRSYSSWATVATIDHANKTFVDFPVDESQSGFYKFRISTTHIESGSKSGASTSPIRVPGTPKAPPEVRTVSIIGNSIIIEWSEPPADMTSSNEVIGYVIQYFSSQRVWVTYADAAFNERTIMIGGLEYGQTYRLRVAARNRLGRGDWSPEASPYLKDALECYTKRDGSDYRGKVSQTRSGKVCLKWSSQSGGDIQTPYNHPGRGLGNHNFCRNPGNPSFKPGSDSHLANAWCYIANEDVSYSMCVLPEHQEHCNPTPDDETEIHKKIPLTNGEICTCAFQATLTDKYLKPDSYIGWTYACAAAVEQQVVDLIENVYNMNSEVCYDECRKSAGCEAFTYSTGGHGNETDVRLCTLFSDLNQHHVEIEKNDSWAQHLGQSIPESNYILSWGCWAVSDPRHPGNTWKDVGLQNYLVFTDQAYSNYSISVDVADGPSEGLYISFIISGTDNSTFPIDVLVTPGTNVFKISNINVGFISALKIIGQIGQKITLNKVEINFKSITTVFVCDWCDGVSSLEIQAATGSCQRKGSIGGSSSANTRQLVPTTTTIYSDHQGFACSSLAYAASYKEAFFGVCPLTPQLISVGLPQIMPDYYVGLRDKHPPRAISKRSTRASDMPDFEIFEEKVTWQEAVDLCLERGTVLAKVFSRTTMDAIIRTTGSTHRGEDLWINGYHVGFTTWRTHEKLPLSLNDLPWESGEPNLSGKCLQLWWRTNTYKLDDDICSNKKMYVCESQHSVRINECMYNNKLYANTECAALMNFNLDSLQNEHLEDESVIVEEASLSLNFIGKRYIQHLEIDGISDPWSRTFGGLQIPRSVLIDTIDTNSTESLAVNIVSPPLQTWAQDRLNGKFMAGRYGLMIRPLQGIQQAGFDDLVIWSHSRLRPRITLKIQLYKWLVGPWSACIQEECLGGMQHRTVVCINAVTDILAGNDDKCMFQIRPHSEQSCVTHYDERCYEWTPVARPGAICRNTGGCGHGTLDGITVCQNIGTQETVPEYFCASDSSSAGTTFHCSDFSMCTYHWAVGEWSECSDRCGDGVMTRRLSCVSSNNTYVGDGMCSSTTNEIPASTKKCQDYSDCNVWQSLSMLRQDQIYGDRQRILTQINLTVPALEAEADRIKAKQNIAESQLELRLQTLRADRNIPEETITAESLEAQARQTVAKNRIQIPADGTTSFPNIGYLGRGYDIFYGNPRHDDGSVDPGFRQSVVGLTYNKVRYSSDRLYLVPDQADLIREMGSYFGSTTSIITSEKTYRKSLSVDVSVSAKGSFDIFSASFSASASYKQMLQSTLNTENIFVDIIGRVIVYDARLSPFTTDVSDEFREAVRRLPAVSCCEFDIGCHLDCPLYDEFIGAFGTHYTSRVLMGGRAVQRHQMTRQAFERQQEREIGAGFSASGGVAGIASFNTAMETKITNSMKESLSQSKTSSTEFFLGGQSGVGEIAEGSTDSLKEWSSTVFDNPVPIKYDLQVIVDLLTEDNFPKEKKINIKEQVLRGRLLSYCSRIPNLRCGDFSERGVDEIGNSVHFGDGIYLSMSTNDGKTYSLQEEGDNRVYIRPSAYNDQSYDTVVTIVPLPNSLCTWARQYPSGPSNAFGGDWVKFMKEVNHHVPSQSSVFTGLSGEDCQDHCKRMSSCKAGTYTSKNGGYCLIFTAKEHVDFRAYYTKTTGAWFWKKTKKVPYPFTYHWSCYSSLDKEHFGSRWDGLQLQSFRSRTRFVKKEQRKAFSILSPIAIMNVQKDEVHYGDPFILVAQSGVVTRKQGEGFYRIEDDSSENLFSDYYLRFRFINDYKRNGMPVKFGDDIMLQEMTNGDRTTEKFLMQFLPYYLMVETKDPCFQFLWFTIGGCSQDKLHVKHKIYETDSNNHYTWNIKRAFLKGLLPGISEPNLSGVERFSFYVKEDGKTVRTDIQFTRPVKRRHQVPGTVDDEVAGVAVTPGFDGHDILSGDFVVTLKRGTKSVFNPIHQKFTAFGRRLSDYTIDVTFQENIKDDDVIHVEMSEEIVDEEGNALIGETAIEQHIYIIPAFTVQIWDASYLVRSDDQTAKEIVLKVRFNKPVVNAERELPDVYDFDVSDIKNETVDVSAILKVEPVNHGRICPKHIACHTEFYVRLAAASISDARQFYFDIIPGRLKSARDFLFVNSKPTLIDFNTVYEN
ncbi:uncharacterized protein LOC100370048 [Saccoglossus kowalevskii]